MHARFVEDKRKPSTCQIGKAIRLRSYAIASCFLESTKYCHGAAIFRNDDREERKVGINIRSGRQASETPRSREICRFHGTFLVPRENFDINSRQRWSRSIDRQTGVYLYFIHIFIAVLCSRRYSVVTQLSASSLRAIQFRPTPAKLSSDAFNNLFFDSLCAVSGFERRPRLQL